MNNIVFGWSLYASDVVSDWYFYKGIDAKVKSDLNDVARIVALVHIILPFVYSSLFLAPTGALEEAILSVRSSLSSNNAF